MQQYKVTIEYSGRSGKYYEVRIFLREPNDGHTEITYKSDLTNTLLQHCLIVSSIEKVY